MLLLCLIALGSKRKSDAGTYTVNTTLAPYFLHSHGINATVPVSMVSLNISQASEASVEPFLSPPGNSYIQATIPFLPAHPRRTWERKGNEGQAQLLKNQGQGEPGRHGHTSGFSVQQKDLYSLLATTSSQRRFPLSKEINAS